jgi:hypothetical protein
MRTIARLSALALLVASAVSVSGCLVVSLHPAYDADSISWDSRLVGAWADTEDNASMDVTRGEWRSYRVHYVHPTETGELTGYLTPIGDERYLDLMPGRGEDAGLFLTPVHVVLRVRFDGERLELTPLSYDWFADRLRRGAAAPGLQTVFDEKQNALIVSPSAALRAWLRVQPAGGPMFGAPAVFVKKGQ